MSYPWKLDAARICLCVFRHLVAKDVGQRSTWWRSEKGERPEAESGRIEAHPHHTAARFLSQLQTNPDACSLCVLEARFELNMPNDTLGLEHQIITAIVNLRL